jgi:hypothetical protein
MYFRQHDGGGGGLIREEDPTLHLHSVIRERASGTCVALYLYLLQISGRWDSKRNLHCVVIPVVRQHRTRFYVVIDQVMFIITERESTGHLL